MFPYYGTKKALAKYYPAPSYDTIIEPFAGAAQYSLYGDNWQKEVILYEAYGKIASIWKWLIAASPADIANLPDMKAGDRINQFIHQLSPEERWLLGFFCNPWSAVPKQTCTRYGEETWKRGKVHLLANIHKCNHWQVFCAPAYLCPDIEATWFIDPPYQKSGNHYHTSVDNSRIDYNHLAVWCRQRCGQVIVCEDASATWLPFQPLAPNIRWGHLNRPPGRQLTEGIWTNDTPSATGD